MASRGSRRNPVYHVLGQIEAGRYLFIEMGVLIDDPGLATRLVHQWRGLIESDLVTKA